MKIFFVDSELHYLNLNCIIFVAVIAGADLVASLLQLMRRLFTLIR